VSVSCEMVSRVGLALMIERSSLELQEASAERVRVVTSSAQEEQLSLPREEGNAILVANIFQFESAACIS